MSHIELLPITEEHILAMADNMHQEDRNSIWALMHLTPEEGVRYTLLHMIEGYTCFIDGNLVGMLGVNRPTLLSPFVAIWFLGTDEIKKHPKAFLTAAKKLTDYFIDKYEWTQNYVDARNKRSIKWLKWLGFTIHPPIPLGIEQRLFHMNELRKK